MKKVVFFMVVVAVVFVGCKTASAPLVEYREKVMHDTIEKVDSVYVSRWIRERGDTVWMTDTLFKFKYLDKYVYICTHDSVPYEVPVPVRMRNGYDRFTSWGFWILALLLCARIAWWAFKTFYLRR